MENPQGKFPAEFSTYQVVYPGDLVFCLFDVDETPRTVGLSQHHGMITGAYTVFQCIEPDIAEYLYLFFLAMDQYKRLRPLYTGLRKVISKDVLLRIKVPMPPPHEREDALKFTKIQATQIDAALQGINRQAEMLQEMRERLVADVVSGEFNTSTVKIDLQNLELTSSLDQIVGTSTGNGERGSESEVLDAD